MTSRSNCAKDSSICSVSRPMLVAVLKDWVTETKTAPAASSRSTSLCKVGEGTGQPVDLVDHDLLDETCVDVGEQAL